MVRSNQLEPVLETDRLILCPMNIERDLDALCEAYADEPTMRYLGGKVMDRAQTWRQMAMIIGHHIERGYSFLSVIDKESGQWVGRVGPWYPHGWPGREVGWTIHPAHTRKGYAREAGQACLEYVRDTLGWLSVIHVIETGNIASERVALSLGSTRLSKIDYLAGIGPGDFNIYGQTF